MPSAKMVEICPVVGTSSSAFQASVGELSGSIGRLMYMVRVHRVRRDAMLPKQAHVAKNHWELPMKVDGAGRTEYGRRGWWRSGGSGYAGII